MGFLGKVFKKKKGGTLFGNLLRGVASSYTGGILGSGKNMIPLDSTDPAQQLTQLPVYQAGQNIGAKALNTTMQVPEVQQVVSAVQKDWIKKNWYLLAMPVLLVLYLLYQNQSLKKNKRY